MPQSESLDWGWALGREGTAAPGVGQKPCDLCAKGVDLLVRCQVRCGALRPSSLQLSEAAQRYIHRLLWKRRIAALALRGEGPAFS